MRKTQLLVSALLLVLFLVACAPKAVPAPAPSPTAEPRVAPAKAAQTLAPAKAPWEEKWDKTVEAAKKEGIVVLYTAILGQSRPLIIAPFQSKYEVRIEPLAGGSPGQYGVRLAAEQRAGIYSADMLITGSGVASPVMDKVDPLEPLLILPELTEPELIKKTWLLGKLYWVNKDHTLLSSGLSYKQYIVINTNAVKTGEINAYSDLLNPKWKGKISIRDPRIPGGGLLWFAGALEAGDIDVNYMRELITKQEVFVTSDNRLQVDWLARGKHAIIIGPQTATVTEFIRLGVPLRQLNLGTPSSTSGNSAIAVLKRAPHPNAARLYINWLLSQEGQTLLSQAGNLQSQRLDVSTDHLDSEIVLKPGVKLFSLDDEEFLKKKDTYYVKLAKELLGP